MNLDDITAVILAGGKGERMRPYEGAKAAVPAAGRPLIHWLLQHLAASGVSKIHVCAGYHAGDVTAAIETYAGRAADIAWSNAGEDAAHGERLLRAAEKIRTKYALVCYGDTIADVPVGDLLRLLLGGYSAAVLTAVQTHCAFGVVRGNGEKDRLVRIEEKPLMPFWVSIGYVLAHSAVCLAAKPADTLVDWVNRLAVDSGVLYYKHIGYHYTVNEEKDLRALETAARAGRLSCK